MVRDLRSLKTFGLGMLGGAVPVVGRFYAQEAATLDIFKIAVGVALGFLLTRGFMAVIGGVAACISREKEPWKIFLVGMTAPALLLSLSLPARSQPTEELYKNPNILAIVVAEQVEVIAGDPRMIEDQRVETIDVLRWNNIIPIVGSYDVPEEKSRWYKVLFEGPTGALTEGWVLGKRIDEVYLSVIEQEQPEFGDLLFRFNVGATPPYPGIPINAREKSFVQQILDGVKLAFGRPTGPWFVIAGSHKSYQDAQRQVALIETKGLKEKGLTVNPKIYKYPDGSGYAVALGGYLTQEHAITLRDTAIEFGFPSDAYLWSLVSER